MDFVTEREGRRGQGSKQALGKTILRQRLSAMITTLELREDGGADGGPVLVSVGQIISKAGHCTKTVRRQKQILMLPLKTV